MKSMYRSDHSLIVFSTACQMLLVFATDLSLTTLPSSAAEKKRYSNPKNPPIIRIAEEELVNLESNPELFDVPQFSDSTICFYEKLEKWRPLLTEETPQIIDFSGPSPVFSKELEHNSSFQKSLANYLARVSIKNEKIVVVAEDAVLNEDPLVAAYLLCKAVKEKNLSGKRRANIYVSLGLVLASGKEWDNSLKCLKEAETIFNQTDNENGLRMVLASSVPIYALKHNYENALSALKKLLYEYECTGYSKQQRNSLAMYFLQEGVMLANLGRFDKARSCFIASIALRQAEINDPNIKVYEYLSGMPSLSNDLKESNHLLRAVGQGGIVPGFTPEQIFSPLQSWKTKSLTESAKTNLFYLGRAVRNLAISLEQTDEVLISAPLHSSAYRIFKDLFGYEHPITERSDMESTLASKDLNKRRGYSSQIIFAEFSQLWQVYELNKKLQPETRKKMRKKENKKKYKPLFAELTTDRVYAQQIKRLSTKYGHDHPTIANALLEMAARKIYEPDKISKELVLIDKALNIYRKGFGADSYCIAGILNYRALVLSKLNRYREAKSNLEKALQNLKKAPSCYSRREPMIAFTLINLAIVCEREGNMNEAISYAKQSIETLEVIKCGKSSTQKPEAISEKWINSEVARRLVRYLNILSTLYELNQQNDLSEKTLVRMQKIDEEFIKKKIADQGDVYISRYSSYDKTDIARSFDPLIRFYKRNKAFNKAAITLEKSLSFISKHFYYYRMDRVINLADCLNQSGNRQKAFNTVYDEINQIKKSKKQNDEYLLRLMKKAIDIDDKESKRKTDIASEIKIIEKRMRDKKNERNR